MNGITFFYASSRLLFLVGCWAGAGLARAQSSAPSPATIPLNDLSGFNKPAANWRIVGEVTASLSQPNSLAVQGGTGVLVNIPLKSEFGQQYNLLTLAEHGDADLELDFLLAKGANSGVYLQGRYEIQLFDSWGVRNPSVADNGSVYERWDDSRPDGSRGYDGHPARQNASRAPGLWQHLKISFQAPRFDAAGRKTDNARLVRVELNGVVIHENVSLSGPTRSPAFANESPTGPLMFQGDHGAVAFRNLRITPFDKPRPQLTNLSYEFYKGKFEQEPIYTKLPPEARGPANDLSALPTALANEFLIRYTGTLKVAEPGLYRFNIGVPGGGGVLRIDNKPVVARAQSRGSGTVELPAGDLPFELIYSKFADYGKPNLGLTLSGPGIREYSLTNSIPDDEPTDPILITASANTLLRSFMDLPGVPATGTLGQDGRGAYRVTHAVSVGSPAQLHYTYDLDNGSVVQVWRGEFLDATPMWNDRGDGSSRPLGMVQRFGKPALFLAPMKADQPWPADTSGSGFRPRGYALDKQDRPTFRYSSYGTTVQDELQPLENGQGFRRVLRMQPSSTPLFARLMRGNKIKPLENGLYVIDDHTYLRLDDTNGATPTVRSVAGQQELVIPVSTTLTYSLLF